MRFGKSAEEAAQEEPRGGGGDFIRYLKDGDTTFRILQEPEDWVYYWEHFNPGGYSFPCLSDDRENCPGCTSDVEKMKKASRKIAFNVMQSYQGTEYVNVYKVPSTLADKLKNRHARIGTITDRDYTITKYKGAGDKVDYDLEGDAPSKVDLDSYDLKDIEEMLEASYNESWGDALAAKESRAKAAEASSDADVAAKVKKNAAEQSEDPPSKPKAQSDEAEGEIEVTEEQLRSMKAKDLKIMCLQEFDTLPEGESSDEIVDWMMAFNK